jgi:hypothetical protein
MHSRVLDFDQYLIILGYRDWYLVKHIHFRSTSLLHLAYNIIRLSSLPTIGRKSSGNSPG